MSILYASIIKIKGNQKVTESKNYNSYKMQIKTMMPEIQNGINIDRFEMEDSFLNYIKQSGVIFLCVSDKRMGGEKPSIFLQAMISKIVSLYGSINKMTEKCEKDLALNSEINIDELIAEYSTGIEQSNKQIEAVNKEVNEIKQEVKNNIKQVYNNMNQLDEILLTSDNVIHNAEAFKKKAKRLEEESRPCCTPCVKTVTYVSLSLITLFVIYTIIAFIRCDSMNAFCEAE